MRPGNSAADAGRRSAGEASLCRHSSVTSPLAGLCRFGAPPASRSSTRGSGQPTRLHGWSRPGALLGLPPHTVLSGSPSTTPGCPPRSFPPQTRPDPALLLQIATGRMLHGTWMLTGITEVWGRAEPQPCQESGHRGVGDEGLHVLTFLFSKKLSSAVCAIKRLGTSKVDIGDTGRNGHPRPGARGAVPLCGMGWDGIGEPTGPRRLASPGLHRQHTRGRCRQCICCGWPGGSNGGRRETWEGIQPHRKRGAEKTRPPGPRKQLERALSLPELGWPPKPLRACGRSPKQEPFPLQVHHRWLMGSAAPEDRAGADAGPWTWRYQGAQCIRLRALESRTEQGLFAPSSCQGHVCCPSRSQL